MEKNKENSLVSRWLCDRCFNFIESPEDGNLEWFTTDNVLIKSDYGYKILHNECQQGDNMVKVGESLSSRSLYSENTNEALGYLLTDLSDERCKENSELIEIIKRLHIIGYEENRNTEENY